MCWFHKGPKSSKSRYIQIPVGKHVFSVFVGPFAVTLSLGVSPNFVLSYHDFEVDLHLLFFKIPHSYMP